MMFLGVKGKPLGLLNSVLLFPTDDIPNLDNNELAVKLSGYLTEEVKYEA